MSRKILQAEAMESSSSEDEEEEEEERKESGSESSSDGGEFDSTNERVKMVPSETHSETDDEVNLSTKPAESQKIDSTKRFDSDVESEYDSDSISESEDLTQKNSLKESSIEPEEALPLTQRKPKKGDSSASQSRPGDDQFVKKGKSKALNKRKEPKLIKAPEDTFAKNVQGVAVKQTPKDNEQSQSLKNEKKGVLSMKKRKLESSQHGGETDSLDSVPISKRRKDVDVAQNDKAGADRNKRMLTSDGSGKKIARKIFSDLSANPSSSKDMSNKVSKADHEPRQQKKASMDACNGPSSPQKQKKSPHVWSTDEEITMASEVLNHVKMGLEVLSRKSDEFWLTLSEALHEKCGVEFSREQLSKKLLRMKQRYQSAAQKIKETHESDKPYNHKYDQNLFDICSQIWGRAEDTTLEDNQAASDFKKEPSKSLVVAANVAKEGKISPNVSKIRPASKATASKETVLAVAENRAGKDALLSEGITTMPMEMDKVEAAKEDNAMDGISSVPDESTVLSEDMCRFLQDKIHSTLEELQEWWKNSMETGMSKAFALIQNSVKNIGDQATRINAMGIAGVGLPMRLWDSTEFQFVHGEQVFQQQWYELHLQELNIYSQRLDLMQKECKLKQEQLKLQLKLKREK